MKLLSSLLSQTLFKELLRVIVLCIYKYFSVFYAFLIHLIM